MKFLIAMDSFKGSLDAVAACRAVARGVEAACPTACCDIAPMADGGEGTLDALLASVGGRRCSAMVHNPLMRPVRAEYGLLDAQNIGGVRGTAGARGFAGVRNARNANRKAEAEPGRVAVVEMARASGLQYVDEHTHDPLHASTFGTGELIRHALDDGARTIIVTLGGSATNDGGAGIAQALGARLLDATGRDLEPGGAALARLDHIDTARMDPRLAHTEVRIATDVTNPLTGPTGASAVFGPQRARPLVWSGSLMMRSADSHRSSSVIWVVLSPRFLEPVPVAEPGRDCSPSQTRPSNPASSLSQQPRGLRAVRGRRTCASPGKGVSTGRPPTAKPRPVSPTSSNEPIRAWWS